MHLTFFQFLYEGHFATPFILIELTLVKLYIKLLNFSKITDYLRLIQILHNLISNEKTLRQKFFKKILVV